MTFITSLLLSLTNLATSAGPPSSNSSPAIAAIEVHFSTRAGEGAAGLKRFLRNGCYQVESQGGGGGGGQVRDSQEGCHLAADVAEGFRRIDALAAGKQLIPTGAAEARGGAEDDLSFGSKTKVILIAADRTSWHAANPHSDRALQAAVNELPGENQWYAEAPNPPVGTGPQVVAVNVSRAGARGSTHFESSLTASGRWWCYRSVSAHPGDEPRLPSSTPKPLTAAAASKALATILRGARTTSSDGDERSADEGLSVQVGFPGTPRQGLQPASLGRTVVQRLIATLRSRVCTY